MSAAQIQAVLASPEAFAGLIASILGSDATQRRSSEDLYVTLQKSRPDACVTNLLQLLRASPAADVRSSCAVFLRKFMKPSSGMPGWEQLSRSTQSVVKRELLLAMSQEQDRQVIKQVADVVTYLACLVLPKPGWPDLLAAINNTWFTSAAGLSPYIREAAIKVVGGLAPKLKKYVPQLAPLLAGCIVAPGPADPRVAMAVQVAAMEAACEFLEALETRKECDRFKEVLPASLAALQAALAAGQAGAAEHMLVALVKMAELDADLWKPHVRAAVSGMLALAGGGGGGASDELRKLAAEFVLTLCDVAPEAVQKECGAGLCGQLLAVLAQFLLEVADDGPEWLDPERPNELDDELGDLPQHGLECILRASSGLDSRAMVMAAVDMTRAWAADGDWRKRHAVLLALAHVVGACEEVIGEGEIAALADLCSAALADAHPRVRWAGVHALGVLLADLGPRMQEQQHSRILPALGNAVAGVPAQGSAVRVQIHACSALTAFLDNLQDDEEEQEQQGEGEGGQQGKAAGQAGAAAPGGAKAAANAALLGPYVQPLAGALLGLLQPASPAKLLENCMDALTRIAHRAGAHFAPCYSQAMPLVLDLLAALLAMPLPAAAADAGDDADDTAARARETRSQLLASCVDCCAYMAKSAGKAAFAEHAPAFAAALGRLCAGAGGAAAEGAAFASDDPLLVPLLSVAQPLAEFLGPDTAVLLPPLLPLLAVWVQQDPDLQVVEEEGEEEEGTSGEASPGGAADKAANASDDGDENGDDDDSSGDDDDQDDSDVQRLRYGGRMYRCSASKLEAKEAAARSLELLARHMGGALAPQAPALVPALTALLVEYPLRTVHASACAALPDLVLGYNVAVTHGSPGVSPAGAQALLAQVWEGLMTALQGAGSTQPTAAAAARLVKALASVVDRVQPGALQQAWVAAAFSALQQAQARAEVQQQAAAAAAEEARAAAAVEQMEGDDEEDEEEWDEEEETDDEDEGDSGDDEEEEEEEEDLAGEDAVERLRQEVAACAGAFARKFGDAVAAMAAQLQLGARGQRQQGQVAVAHVHGGMVA